MSQLPHAVTDQAIAQSFWDGYFAYVSGQVIFRLAIREISNGSGANIRPLDNRRSFNRGEATLYPCRRRRRNGRFPVLLEAIYTFIPAYTERILHLFLRSRDSIEKNFESTIQVTCLLGYMVSCDIDFFSRMISFRNH
jgi:hypothetical protein